MVMSPECAAVRVVHSLFLSHGPIDEWDVEDGETMFGCLGERVRGHTPSIIRMAGGITATRRVRLPDPRDVDDHYGGQEGSRALMPPPAAGPAVVLPHMMQIPAEWAVRALDKQRTPYDMYCWVADQVAGLPPRDRPAFHALEDWCLACCARRTASGHAETSALAVEIPVAADVTEEVMEDAELRLRVTLRLGDDQRQRREEPRRDSRAPSTPPNMGAPEGSVAEQLSLLTRAFMEGASAHKRSVESVVAPSGGRFTDLQMARLQGWCGLEPAERDRIPPIWEKLQATRDKDETRAVLTKHFERVSASLEEPLCIYFSDRLVEDIAKLRCAPNRDPDYASAHLGISILAVAPVSASAQVRMDEEALDTREASVLTLADVRAAKKGPPAAPKTFDQGMRLLRQYKYFLTELFGPKCDHLREVSLVYLSLRSMQNRVQTVMGADEWAHLTWAVIVDARQFFGTFSDEEDIAAGVFPQSNLGTTRSLIQAHTVMRVRDTPAQWLPPSPRWTPARSRAEDLGGGRASTKRPGGGSAGTAGTGGGRAGKGEGKLDDATNPVKRNPGRHPLLAELMRPHEAAGLQLSMRGICSAAGINNIRDLGRWPDSKPCWRWLLGECRERCPSGMDHLGAAQVEMERAKALSAKLAPGIKKLVEEAAGGGAPPAKKQKKSGG